MANKIYDYTTPSEYTFNSELIEIVGGVVTLKQEDYNIDYSASERNILTLLEFNGNLYASGNERIYEKDGTWNEIYNTNENFIHDFIEFNGKMYIATSRSGVIFEFDGSNFTINWDSSQTHMYCFCIYNNELYVGTRPNGIIYKFNGTTWDLAYQTNDTSVFCMHVYDGKLFAGTNDAIYSFNGSSWNLEYFIDAQTMCIYNDILYTGGINGEIYEFDKFTWAFTYDTGEVEINKMYVYNNKMYVGTSNVGNIHIFDSSTWQLDTNLNERDIFSFCEYQSKLYIGTGNSYNIYVVQKLSSLSPSIEPTDLFTPGDVVSWDSFGESVGPSHTGVVRYCLYKEDKLDKYYWNGSSWSTGGSSVNSNEISVINANISTFDTTPYDFGYIAYLISNGSETIELDLNDLLYTVGQAPLVNAGLDKSTFDNTNLKPFSDAVISDPNGDINLATAYYKIESASWIEIPIGSYPTLQEAIRDFEYTFNNVGNITCELRIIDEESITSEDLLVVTVDDYEIIVSIIDDKDSSHLTGLTFDPGDGTGQKLVDSPFIYSWEYGNYDIDVFKLGYHDKTKSISIMNEDDITIRMDKLSTLNLTKCSIGFDEENDIIRSQAWLEKDGSSVLTPSSCEIKLIKDNGIVIWTETSTTPTSDGIFYFEKTPSGLSLHGVYIISIKIIHNDSSFTSYIPLGSIDKYGIQEILQDTNEIQSKLPSNYIMGSSDNTNKDDEIEDGLSKII